MATTTTGAGVTMQTLVDNVHKVSYHQPRLEKSAFEYLEEAAKDEALCAEWVENANGVTPILHHKVPALLDDFLVLKRKYGSKAEKELYEGKDREWLVTRLLSNRPLTFFNPDDTYLLKDKTCVGGDEAFLKVGSSEEQAPIVLKDFLSYDEIALAAIVSVSVPTHFINSGGRFNAGAKGADGTYVPRGIYSACIGARFEVVDKMEWQTIMVTPEQNTAAKGYGCDPLGGDPPADDNAEARGGSLAMRVALRKAWATALGLDVLPHYAEAKAQHDEEKKAEGDSGSFLELAYHYLVPSSQDASTPTLFSKAAYKSRLRLTIDPFLMDASTCAQKKGQKAYAHVVGLGIGAWMVDERQAALMVEAYAEALTELKLPGIDTVDFSWFNGVDSCDGVSDGAVFGKSTDPETNVKIVFSRRDPAAPLENPALLLVAMYAWDGNSYPGNEYWLEMLQASGDPAAACCSSITALQNPDVNPTRMNGAAAVAYGLDGVCLPLSKCAAPPPVDLA